MTPFTPHTYPGQRSRNRFAPLTSAMTLVLLTAPFLAAQTSAPAQTPFQQQVALSIANGGSGVFSTVPVPVGKRMIIEYVSLSGSAPTGQKLSASVQTTVANVTCAYAIRLQVQESVDGTDKLESNQMMKVYAEGPEFHISLLRAKVEGAAQLTLNISGYLESIQ